MVTALTTSRQTYARKGIESVFGRVWVSERYRLFTFNPLLDRRGEEKDAAARVPGVLSLALCGLRSSTDNMDPKQTVSLCGDQRLP
jgi:hypothetical protein